MNPDRRYEVRLLDRTIALFSAGTDWLGRPYVSDVSFDPAARHLLPAMLMGDCSAGGMLRWLSSRVIPKHRAFAEKILAQYGLEAGDTLGIIDVCMGLSVSDSYWIAPEGFAGTWSEYNLFENELDEVLALVAYTGYTSSQRHEAGLSSEWTTDGTFPKCWRRIRGRLVLYKAGNPLNEGFANRDFSPYSEYFASQLLDVLGLPHVRYDLDMWKGKLAATCPAFTTPHASMVQLYHLTDSGSLGFNLATVMRVGELAGRRDLLDSFLDILWVDALIANTDRHAGNVAFMRDGDTGAIIGLAPIYDNNMSLFPTDMPSDYPDWPDRAERLYPSGSDITFDRLVAQFTMPRHHEWARSLLQFRFENHPAYPVPQERLEALGAYVSSRAKRLLDMPIVREEELRPRLLGIASHETGNVDAAPVVRNLHLLFPGVQPDRLEDAITLS